MTIATMRVRATPHKGRLRRRPQDLARADDLERIFIDAAQVFAGFKRKALGPGKPVGPVPPWAVIDHLPIFIDQHGSSAGTAGAMRSGKYLHPPRKALAGRSSSELNRAR